MYPVSTPPETPPSQVLLGSALQRSSQTFPSTRARGLYTGYMVHDPISPHPSTGLQTPPDPRWTLIWTLRSRPLIWTPHKPSLVRAREGYIQGTWYMCHIPTDPRSRGTPDMTSDPRIPQIGPHIPRPLIWTPHKPSLVRAREGYIQGHPTGVHIPTDPIQSIRSHLTSIPGSHGSSRRPRLLL